jgi:hypothetical protein
MQKGATIKLMPSWVPSTLFIDIAWDTDQLTDPSPTGAWWGDFAQLSGQGVNQGEWHWDANALILQLWVPVPGVAGFAIYLAHLDNFDFNTIPSSGQGALTAGVTPTTTPPPFDWEVN